MAGENQRQNLSYGYSAIACVRQGENSMDETKKPITKQDLQAAILTETVKLVEEQREEILRRAKKTLAERKGK